MFFLPQSFYHRDVLQVARELLGMRLVRLMNGVRLSGTIVETEAYRGEEDLACHASHGKTTRTAIMYGEAGRAYIYFTYGMHWLLNVVTGEVDFPAAVLIRAIVPMEGISQIASHRQGRPQKHWCDGPAKICQSLQIDGSLNGIRLTDPNAGLWIEEGQPIPADRVITTKRVGIDSVPEPWKSIPWRFVATEKETKS